MSRIKKKSIFLILFFIILSCTQFTYNKNNICRTHSNLSTFINPIVLKSPTIDTYIKTFSNYNIVYIENFFNDNYFQSLKSNILSFINPQNTSRNETFSSIRRAITMNSSNLKHNVQISDLYYSNLFQNFLSTITNIPLQNVNCSDESSMNLLIYNKPDDFISWHYDPNHYVGTRLTVLINIVNINNFTNDLSSSELQYKIKNKIYTIKMKPNSILIFNGSLIEHQATGIKENENRILLSFTYCDICKETMFGKLLKSIKSIVLGY